MNPVPRKIEVLLERYWINQPSKLQPYHKWHGAHVLAYIEPGERYTRAYFTSGNIISAIIAVEALSKGWPNSGTLGDTNDYFRSRTSKKVPN